MMRLRLIVGNQRELWISLALMPVGIFLFRLNRPEKPIDTIGYASVTFFCWFLSLNALLDFKRSSWPLRVLAVIWFAFMTYFAWQVVTIDFMTNMRWSLR